MLTVAACRADVLIDVLPSSGPNPNLSAAYSTWRDVAINALMNGLTAVGDPATDPAAYSQATHLYIRDNIASSSGDPATSFPSWRGWADPGAVFGPAFANEYGNVLYFGLRATGVGGSQFALSSLTYAITSTDPSNALGFTGAFSDADVYGPRRVGINYGGDGIRGTADDLVITSGSAAQLVNELYYVGVGTASLAGTGAYPELNQTSLNGVAYYYAFYSPLIVTGTYTLTDTTGLVSSGSASVDFTVPEPAAAGLVLAGLAVLVVRRRGQRA